MKLAPVVPPGAEHYLPDTQASFCFANRAAEDPHYAQFFANRKGVIMDWPVYEDLELTITPIQLFAVASLVHPDFLIIPDVRHNAANTLIQADAFMSLYPGYHAATGVLQGRTLDEYVACAIGMKDMNFKRLAIPKDFVKNTGLPRTALLEALVYNGVINEDINIHLLGGDWPYLEASEIAQEYPQVISMDTAEPWNAARNHQEIWTAEPPPRSKDFNKLNDLPRPCVSVFYQNIKWLQEQINDHHN